MQLQKIKILLTKIAKENCLLLIGPNKSGKTTLIKHFSGTKLCKVNDDQFVDQNSQQLKGDSLEHGIQIDFAWIIDTQKNLLVLEIQDLFSNVDEEDKNKNGKKLFLGLFIWASLSKICKNVGINIVVPYECLVETDKLTLFLKRWESLLPEDEQTREQIKKATSVTLSKCYIEEDIQDAFNTLSNISQQEQLSENSTFLQPIQKIFPFTNQQPEADSGQQLLLSIFEKIQFIPIEKMFPSQNAQLLPNRLRESLGSEVMSIIANQFINEMPLEISIQGTLVRKFLFCFIFNKYPQLQQKLPSYLKQLTTLIKQSQLEKEEQIQIECDKVELESQDYEQIHSSIIHLLQNIQQTQKVSLVEELFQSIFSKSFSKKISKASKIYSRLQTVCQLMVQEIEFLKIFSEKYVQQKLQEVLKVVSEDLVQAIKKHSIFDILEESDPDFKSKNYYEIYSKYFKKEGDGDKGSDEQVDNDDDVGEQIIDNEIKRNYLKNQMRQKILTFLDGYVEQKNQKPETILQINKLWVKIEKEKGDVRPMFNTIFQKLLEYRQYETCLKSQVLLCNLPQVKLLRTYFEYLKTRCQQNRFNFLTQTLMPFLLKQAAIPKDSNHAILAYGLLRRCSDFIESEKVTNKEDYSKLQKTMKKIRIAEFEYTDGEKPKLKEEENPFKTDPSIKKDTKTNLPTKFKEVASLMEKTKAVINYIREMSSSQA